MDPKKMKILMIVDIVILVILVIVMMSLKEGYSQQAQSSVKTQLGAYQEGVNAILHEQWTTVDQNGMAWKLVYKTMSGSKTEAEFNANVKAIEGDKEARARQVSHLYTAAGIPEKAQSAMHEKGLADKFLLKDENGVKEIACGKNCVITFTFAKGKLKSADYKALESYNMAENFKLDAPKPFVFE